MSMPKLFAIRIGALVVAPILSMFLGGDPVIAQNISPEYTFLVASGFLCGSGSCPAASRSANGDTYEISGAGTFNTQSKSASAAGTFTHKSPNGSVIETGVWLSSQLVSFDLYGVAPNAFRQRGLPIGLQALSPKLTPMSLSPIPAGGLAVFRIRLLPVSGMPMGAVLQVNCTFGDVPRERSVEGIRLKLDKSPAEFSEEVGGSVMFLAMPPQPPTAGKGNQQEPSSGAAQTPNH